MVEAFVRLLCPECGKDAGYHAMICEKGHVFTVENPFKRNLTCPKCETHGVRPMREEDIP